MRYRSCIFNSHIFAPPPIVQGVLDIISFRLLLLFNYYLLRCCCCLIFYATIAAIKDECTYLLKYVDRFVDSFDGFASTDFLRHVFRAATLVDSGIVEGEAIESMCQFILQSHKTT